MSEVLENPLGLLVQNPRPRDGFPDTPSSWWSTYDTYHLHVGSPLIRFQGRKTPSIKSVVLWRLLSRNFFSLRNWPDFDSRVWRPVPGNSCSREFFTFFDGIGTGIEKNWYQKNLGTGIEKIWYRKKSWNQNRKFLVPKKVLEQVSKIFGTKKKYWNQSQNLSEY